jgi:hypothetical protein
VKYSLMQGYGTYKGWVNYFVYSFSFSWSLHVQTIASGLNGQEMKNERNEGKTDIISSYICTASAQMGF